MEELDLGATIRGFVAGQKVFGRYTLMKQLGRGGMGIVWRARDESLEQDVAIKMLPEIVAHDPASVRELKRETSRNQQLSHPHILRVFDFVESGGLCGITMEVAEGGSLSQRRLDQPSEHFEVEEIRAWVGQLCDALDQAHRRAKVVHRDLKPANLMLTAGGELKVTDFGIAASLSESVTRVSKQAGSSGTPLYMSPQQMMGEKPAVTDDIYALGATLYELLTGKPPFYAGNIILQLQNKVPPAMAQRRVEFEKSGAPIPAEWEATIAACLAKEPADRPQSAREVAARLSMGPNNQPRLAAEVDTARPSASAQPAGDRRIPRQAASIAGVGSVTTRTAGGNSGAKVRHYAGVATAVLFIGLGWYFGFHAPEEARRADRVRQEEARKAEEAERLRVEKQRADAGRQAAERARLEQEQLDYAVILARIEALVEGSPAAQHTGTEAAVRSYLAGAPEKYSGEVEERWSERQAGWKAAVSREQDRLAQEEAWDPLESTCRHASLSIL